MDGYFRIPPDTEMSAPVTYDDASLASYSTGPTISAGSATRGISVQGVDRH